MKTRNLMVASFVTIITLGLNTFLHAQTLPTQNLPQQTQQLQQSLQQQVLRQQQFTSCKTQCTSLLNTCTLNCPPSISTSGDLGDRHAACLDGCYGRSAACDDSCVGQ